VRYRFSEFTLSPKRRMLEREGVEVPIIPRYFDLLLLLVERRHEAVHRQEIFEKVWTDAIVSDSALSQAIRTIRRTLGDDSKEPRFVRTVSRHGYRFVFADVIEEPDEGPAASAKDAATVADAARADEAAGAVRFEAAAENASAPRAAWLGGTIGGAVAGVSAGAVGGVILALAPGSTAPIAIAPVLAAIAGVAGAAGGLGVGAGVGVADSRPRANRVAAVAVGAALGGGTVGLAAEWLMRWSLETLVGLHINVGGGVEGLTIGLMAGLGLALATERDPAGGISSRGARWQAALITALVCGLAGLALSFAGRPLAGGTIHEIASQVQGSQATLAPLGRLIGEPDFGPVTSAVIAFGECAAFGLGLALGVVRK
jgi:DNA-binding winged helix-turn-helix (wHTH) protein